MSKSYGHKNVQIPAWLFNCLCKYHITEADALPYSDERELLRKAIRDGLTEKAEKMLNRMEYEQKMTGE